MTDIVEFYENDGDNELLKLYNPFHSKADGRFSSAGGGKGGTIKSGGLASMIKGNPTTSKPMSVKGKINSSYTGKLVGAGLVVGAGALAVGSAAIIGANFDASLAIQPKEVQITDNKTGETKTFPQEPLPNLIIRPSKISVKDNKTGETKSFKQEVGPAVEAYIPLVKPFYLHLTSKLNNIVE